MEWLVGIVVGVLTGADRDLVIGVSQPVSAIAGAVFFGHRKPSPGQNPTL